MNTRSSTETELVSVDAYMPEFLWYLYFIQSQGYGVKYAEIHQDNVSAQMLETNGKFSSLKKPKHIKKTYSLSRIRSTAKRLRFWTAHRE